MNNVEIFDQLRKSGKDLRNYLSISSSSIYLNDITYEPWNVVDGSDDKFFHSQKGIGQWFYIISAKPLRIIGFSITLYISRDPLHWKIEGTNDGESFKTIYNND